MDDKLKNIEFMCICEWVCGNSRVMIDNFHKSRYKLYSRLEVTNAEVLKVNRKTVTFDRSSDGIFMVLDESKPKIVWSTGMLLFKHFGNCGAEDFL